jgi:hypothetical protein
MAMMRSMFCPALFLGAWLASASLPGAALAQTGGQDAAVGVAPPGVTQELLVRDGTRAFGRVERVTDDRVVFRTSAGAVLEVDRSQILSVKQVEGRVVKGEYYPEDANPTRLFFGPTARSVPRGSGYMGIYELVMPFVQVGITDRISIGGGTPLVFGGGSDRPFWVTPKVQVFANESTQAAVGVMHFLNVDDGDLGIAYGVVTRGSSDTAVTLGAGFAYEHSSGDGGGAAVGMIGAEHRVSRRLKLVTENYLFHGGGLGTFGVRFLGERLSADLGLVVPIGAGDFFAFPMVNFVWQFGGK